MTQSNGKPTHGNSKAGPKGNYSLANRTGELTDKQVRFAFANVVEGLSLTELADRFEINRTTAHKWRHEDWFIHLVRQMRQASLDIAAARYADLAGAAYTAYQRLLTLPMERRIVLENGTEIVEVDVAAGELVRKAAFDVAQIAGLAQKNDTASINVDQRTIYVSRFNESGRMETSTLDPLAVEGVAYPGNSGGALPEPGMRDEGGEDEVRGPVDCE